MIAQGTAVHVTIDRVVVTGLGAADAQSAVDALRSGLVAGLPGLHGMAPGSSAHLESLPVVRVQSAGARAPHDLGNAGAQTITAAIQNAGER